MSKLNFNITIITLNVNHIIESKRIRKDILCKHETKESRDSYIISDKVDFRAKRKLPETEDSKQQ